MNPFVEIDNVKIGEDYPTYFIADIAANHDGDFSRAKKLIKLAKESGANAVKFQHHNVTKYVSDLGFRQLGNKFSHQKNWKKSIYEVYKEAEVPIEWTAKLKEYSDQLEITFFSTAYDLDLVDYLNSYVPAFKVGSGDINWDAMLIEVAKKGKPIIFASGASTICEVQKAVQVLKKYNSKIVLLQCNTNYTGSMYNFNYINLNVLKTYKTMFPDIVLGLSDHTLGHITVLGSVALGGRVIEKHFTDNINRDGPDHKFSMDPIAWKEMVQNTRMLEMSLGKSLKEIEENEKETIILQRRSIRVIRDMKAGEKITMADIQFQRPAPLDSFSPNSTDIILNKILTKDIINGDFLRLEHIKW